MLITNFRKEKRTKYDHALKLFKEKTKRTDLYIDDNAYSDGIKLNNYNALRCSGFGILSDFWDILRSL